MNSASLPDEGLRCPFCGYNLTGLPEDLCPECGRGFSRTALRLARDHKIPIWDDRREIGYVRAFLGTVCFMWCHPVSFACSFPKRPSRLSARCFSYTCYALAFGLISIALALAPVSDLADTVATVCGFAVGARIFESQLFWCLYRQGSLDTPPLYTKRMRSAFVRFTSSYLLLPAIGCSTLLLVTDLGKLAWSHPVVITLRLAIPAAYVFWWTELVLLTAHIRDVRCAIVVAFCVPIFALLSVIAAGVIAYFAFALLYGMIQSLAALL